MVEIPDLTNISGTFDEMLNWLKARIADLEAKLPPGVKLSDADLKAIADQGVGKYGASFWTALAQDGLEAIRRGYGPNIGDQSFFA
jgi:hypothetical protein